MWVKNKSSICEKFNSVKFPSIPIFFKPSMRGIGLFGIIFAAGGLSAGLTNFLSTYFGGN